MPSGLGQTRIIRGCMKKNNVLVHPHLFVLCVYHLYVCMCVPRTRARDVGVLEDICVHVCVYMLYACTMRVSHGGVEEWMCV